MLKRYQVLLPDWLEEYVKLVADKYDLSFSEVIRTMICNWILAAMPNVYPELKLEISPEDIYEMIKSEAQDNMEREDIHRALSKIYFETRKAVEYRMGKEKKPKKK
ncbi:unnamed protein product [marine sediment metagenome]|uniref:Uncharacterized protein n=1 Tax=marine sediment metagenome TaxID=412755 RepID=X1I4Q8_9ZZZZ